MSGRTLIANTSTSNNRQQDGTLAERSKDNLLRQARVAILDDEETVRTALTFQLSTAGFNVTALGSACELFNTGGALEFACIVADIFMPQLNGLVLLEKLREAGNPVPVVLITGQGHMSIGVRAMKAGAFDALQKPIDEEALLNAVKQAIELSLKSQQMSNRRAMLEKQLGALPRRQREVFSLLTAGFSNKEVGAELLISERTVKAHRRLLRENLGIDSLAELSRVAELLQISPNQPHSRG
jgi:two-component system, LuxR family, response regulator FixJ